VRHRWRKINRRLKNRAFGKERADDELFMMAIADEDMRLLFLSFFSFAVCHSLEIPVCFMDQLKRKTFFVLATFRR